MAMEKKIPLKTCPVVRARVRVRVRVKIGARVRVRARARARARVDGAAETWPVASRQQSGMMGLLVERSSSNCTTVAAYARAFGSARRASNVRIGCRVRVRVSVSVRVRLGLGLGLGLALTLTLAPT